ncbi:MAG: putative toxin-antitoxin system toxin component, PIN family [Spirosomaceae bacterium]|jgi:hypothetical protein|nr:putative toxin-antitoxin system toxin component, PIN family [Spirosomataceae bacterium]
MKIVIDTNLFISAFISLNSRQRLNLILENPIYEILMDDTLFNEIYTVINRPKFTKYVNSDQIENFLKLINERTTFINTQSVVQFSPDPNDDFLLALCKDGEADYLLTGNKIDLLELFYFGKTKILSLSEFIQNHLNS